MIIPVIVFCYKRVPHLARLLDCLERDGVTRIYAFCDGPASAADVEKVHAVRRMIRSVRFAETMIEESPQNRGLGPSVLHGVTKVARLEPAFIVAEDDLIFSPGTYSWMAAALKHYSNEPCVMSVTGWTHPRVTPPGTTGAYFDRRAECWLWGSWSRAWTGMDVAAEEKMHTCANRGIAPDVVGHDLPGMAAREISDRIWAVRWLYHHLENGGLCLRPTECLVRHLGNDGSATHAGSEMWDARLSPAAPDATYARWPPPSPAHGCEDLWRKATAPPAAWKAWFRAFGRRLGCLR